MSIGKTSINRVAEGLDGAGAAPMSTEIPSVELEKTIVEGTAEKAEKKPTAKKPAAKKPAEKKAEEKPAEENKEATVAPELVGQSVAAPAARRGRKPGSKNKKTAAKQPAAKRTYTRRVQRVARVAIGEELPVYLL